MPRLTLPQIAPSKKCHIGAAAKDEAAHGRIAETAQLCRN